VVVDLGSIDHEVGCVGYVKQGEEGDFLCFDSCVCVVQSFGGATDKTAIYDEEDQLLIISDM
jgi:hypothetical protein